MSYYGRQFGGVSLYHSEMAKKRDLNGESVSEEKGADNKKNNTSEYNHEYYSQHKEKWSKSDSEKKEDSKEKKKLDDEDKKTKENQVEGTDFYTYKDDDGNTIVMQGDLRWTIPDGGGMSGDIKKALQGLHTEDFSSVKAFARAVQESIKGFDADAAADDVIKGKYGSGADRKKALGDKYDEVQKKVNEKMKKSGSSKKSSGSSEKSKEKSSSSGKKFAESYEEFKKRNKK